MGYVHYYGQLTHLTVTSDDHGVIELSDIIKWSTMKNQPPQVCLSWVEV